MATKPRKKVTLKEGFVDWDDNMAVVWNRGNYSGLGTFQKLGHGKLVFVPTRKKK